MIIKASKYKTEDDILWREARLLHKQFLSSEKRWGVGTAIVRELENIKLSAIKAFDRYGLGGFYYFYSLHDFLQWESYESKALVLYQQYPEFFRNFYPAISDIFMDLSIVAKDAEDKIRYGFSAIAFINLAYLFFTNSYYDDCPSSSFFEVFNLAVRRVELLHCFVSRSVSEFKLSGEDIQLCGRLRVSALDGLKRYSGLEAPMEDYNEGALKTLKETEDRLQSLEIMLKQPGFELYDIKEL